MRPVASIASLGAWRASCTRSSSRCGCMRALHAADLESSCRSDDFLEVVLVDIVHLPQALAEDLDILRRRHVRAYANDASRGAAALALP
mmetsp:Transcript_4101/g.7870  ORF Transcript_4101/g.7870 Transcript_4101/m.7870 type:complete len:89 (+) Transcript_4101:104-370(+)